MIDQSKALFDQLSSIGKALANSSRLEMIVYLAQCEHSVEQLSNATGLTFANTSHHLQQLRAAGLVTSRKEAQKVFYRLNGDDVAGLMTAMRSVAENHLVEVQDILSGYLYSKDQMEPISREELSKRMEEGSVLVIDVRPEPEYKAGHVPGAVNLTLDDIRGRISELTQDQEVVAYCRGPHCVLAFEAVEYLRSQGIKSRRLEYGFPEWKMVGGPVERSDK